MDYEKLINEVKEKIDQGFDKMERQIKNPSMIDRYSLAATYKAIKFSDAIITLCRSGLVDESMPILRSLIEHSINMRWIMIKNTKNKLKKYLNDLGEKGFGEEWTNGSLLKRMEDVGFKNRDYYDFCVKFTYSFSHVNASSLNWSEVINHPKLQKSRMSPQATYAVVAQMLGHVMKALDDHFNGYFKDYNSIWNQINVDPQIREKFERARKLLA